MAENVEVPPQEATSLNLVKTTVRVDVSWSPRSLDWALVRMRMMIDEEFFSGWVQLTPKDAPWTVSRQYSGLNSNREAPELTVIACLRKVLADGGFQQEQVRIRKIEEMVGQEGTDYRYWVDLYTRIGVAVRSGAEGSVLTAL